MRNVLNRSPLGRRSNSCGASIYSCITSPVPVPVRSIHTSYNGPGLRTYPSPPSCRHSPYHLSPAPRRPHRGQSRAWGRTSLLLLLAWEGKRAQNLPRGHARGSRKIFSFPTDLTLPTFIRPVRSTYLCVPEYLFSIFSPDLFSTLRIKLDTLRYSPTPVICGVVCAVWVRRVWLCGAGGGGGDSYFFDVC